MTIKLPRTKEIDDQLAEAGIDTLTYDSQWRQYRVRIESGLGEKQQQTLLGLIRQSRECFGK